MGLSEEQFAEIRQAIESSLKPLIFFHDDPDGLCSFLLLWRQIKRGHGIMMKSTPRVTAEHLSHVQKYGPDKIFIVDLAVVDQEFLDKAGCDVYWIDHHEPLERKKAHYFNPRINEPDRNIPATNLCYNAVKKDLWIAMIGTVADWVIPDFTAEFEKEYPDLWRNGITNPDDGIFNTRLGELIRIFSFILKGTTKDAMQYVEMLKSIRSPYEILDRKSEDGIRIFAAARSVNDKYGKLLARAESYVVPENPFVIFTYSGEAMALAKDLSNEMLHRHKDKYVIIAREKNNEMKVSIRSAQKPIRDAVKKSIVSLRATGGGHEMACGANISKDDFEIFVQRLKDELSD